jgi:competence protein ComGC
MRNKLGFTLVELMGILVVLSLLLIMTVPSITKTFRGTQENNILEFERGICNAVKTYSNIEEDASVTETTVTVSTLMEKGYIQKNDEMPNDKTPDLGSVKYVHGEDICTCIDTRKIVGSNECGTK